MAVVAASGLVKSYGEGRAARRVLDGAALSVQPGEVVAILGRSGSGKSTLLHLLAGLDRPTRGEICWPALGDSGMLRPGPVAVVFQGPSLLPPLTIEENVALPLVLDGHSDSDAHRQAREALERLDLAELAAKLPEEVSGGQAQRVAVARALAGRPRLLLADEPTGQLDRASGAAVVDALLAAVAHSGAALMVATHDPAVSGRLGERWEMHSGRLERAPEASWSR
jgi:ABC-type lipoprotein export system ATPase subunit